MRIGSCVVAIAFVSRLAHATPFTPVGDFGANPGALRMYEYVPAQLPADRPLVVVMHGCSQQAAAMEATGWHRLADAEGFAVVYAEQPSANNPVTCFNWAGEYGDPANLVRGRGENQSVMSMVDKAIATHGSDPERVYIVGFSAGGGFASVMLATWPDRFAAGAIMSGLPYRCATSVNGAFSCMNPGTSKTPEAWGDLVRAASTYSGARPRVQIWHGANDTTVATMNGGELVEQWTDVLGADQTADATETFGEATRTRYKAGDQVVVEHYAIATMGHAIVTGDDATGSCPATTGAYFSNLGVCSTRRAAAFFGLLDPGGGSGSGSGGDAGAGGGDDPRGDRSGCSVGASRGGGGHVAIAIGLVLVVGRRRGRRRRADGAAAVAAAAPMAPPHGAAAACWRDPTTVLAAAPRTRGPGDRPLAGRAHRMHVGAAMPIAHRIACVAAVLVASRTAGATLTKVNSFGTNPGALAMYEYVPAGLTAGKPLVVVLHGCTQTAASMENAGWNQLADANQFAVIYPEQQTANNPVRCFNWAGEYGDPADLVRGQGENQSIISMIDTAIAAHGIDPAKVYIVGFSAGAAFVSVMLATWPERFAGGAIMSGLPYRCATTVSGAYSCQSPGVTKTAAQWGDLVRGAATFTGARPRIQIWHGASDSIVVPANQVELIKQWTDVMGIDDTADETESIGNATRTAYRSGSTIVVESYTVTGMGHATAVGADPLGPCTGVAGSYFEDRGICATLRAARFLGVVGGEGGHPDVAPPTVAIVSPANGDTVTGQVTIVVAANDDVAMGSVALAIDGTPLGGDDTMAPYQFDWHATGAGAGPHALVATARDAAGNSITTTAMVTVPAGGGGGSGSGDPPTNELPGCSLDAGRGGAGWLGGLAAAFVVVLRRRWR